MRWVVGVSGGGTLVGATVVAALDELGGDVTFLTVVRFSFSLSTTAFRPRLVKGKLARPIS